MMDKAWISIYLLGGIGLLSFGAHALIRGAASLGFRLGLPLLVVGLTILGYGTGMPEVVVSVQASMAGNGDIAMGNVIGSNIANVGLILGITALFSPPALSKEQFGYESVILLVVTGLFFFLFLFSSEITRAMGVVFIAGLVGYTIWAIYYGWRQKGKEESAEKPPMMNSVWKELLFIGVGFLSLFFGGKWLLQGAMISAKFLGFSEAVIGLTVVALGTSLPELAACLASVIHKHGEAAIGNIVGSNIFNILGIVGIASVVRPIQIIGIHWVDYAFMVFFTVVLWGVIRTGSTVTRREGMFLILCYGVYLIYLLVYA
ncbi:MAG: calcium/sodium antiporter [Waddliaceae bacterium]